MKNFFRDRLKKILKSLALATIRKYQPEIVAITGSVGKTSTKEAIYAVLRNWRRTRANSGNFNNEFGVPLTILGEWRVAGGIFFWFKVVALAVKNLIFKVNYPEILILEYAADRPGDIRYLLDIARPRIGVVTSIGDIPAHIERYSGRSAVAREKGRLVEALPSTGMAVLNRDDELVFGMRERSRSHIITFGFDDGAEVKISNFKNRSENCFSGVCKSVGISFKLEYNGNFIPVSIDRVFGKAPAYAVAAAVAVGLSFGMNLIKAVEALQRYEPLSGRMRLLAGVKETLIIDDSYNSSPLSVKEAIETIKDLKARRKIAVLGDMLELGKFTAEAHELVGGQSVKVFDALITVGLRAKFIADSAIKAGFNPEKVLSFDTADQAKLEIQALIKKGDLILIKGSRAMALDKVVREIELTL